MSFIDDILRFFGLLSNDDQPGTVPVVAVKVLARFTLTGIDKGATLTLDQLVTQAAAQPDSAPLQALRRLAPNLVLNWAFVSVSMADINDLTSRATAADPTYEAPQFDHYFRVPCIDGFDSGALADALNAWTEVIEYAYVVAPAADPAVNPTTDPLFTSGQQKYLSAGPIGVDAPAAWAKGADGTGTSFIDIEQGWFLKHQDLPQPIGLLQGTNLEASKQHGCAVLGEIVGINNTVGIVGAAPLTTPAVMSINNDLSRDFQMENLPDRILNAAVNLVSGFGNVILVEVQNREKIGGKDTFVPAETDQHAWDAIRHVTQSGVIVIEPSGNDGVDLDAYVMQSGPNKGKHTLSRTTPGEYQESGAIMVGACTSVFPHARWTAVNPQSGRLGGTNFGSRVDCYAWGENIVTTGYNPHKPTLNDRYWGVNLIDVQLNKVAFFGGTSGAAPIIAGCCLLIQHLRGLLKPQSGSGKLNWQGMRQILSNPNNGTVSATPDPTSGDRIGVMPDLAKIIANEFQP